METRIFQIETRGGFDRAVAAAADLLRRGEIVAIPTETVYGLAANALDGAAVRKIYEAKGRPAENPIIVHVSSIEMALACVEGWPDEAQRLARRFWPGPMTLVLPKSPAIPGIVTAGGSTVGVRWPLHPFAQELIQACGFPLAAPSANLSNDISPTTAGHVFKALAGRVPLIVDAGPSSVGIESTVLDLSVKPPRLLRPGMIALDQIEATLGVQLGSSISKGQSGMLKSPGLMKRHYSPRASLRLRKWRDEEELLRLAGSFGMPLSRIHVLAHEVIPRANPFGRVAVIPQDPEAYARALYMELHRCDELAASLILVEELPEGAAWIGIRDRLNRASAEEESA